VDELNRRWNTAFWGHTLSCWADVVVPSERNDDNKWYQPIMLDYLRFMTDSNIACFRNEYDVLKAATPKLPIMTNMSGFIKKIDQFKMTAAMDIVGWDNYPSPGDDPALVAFKHDLMRGLKGGQPFLMVEQSPNQQNWQPYNVLKRPGEVRRLSYQALAHGSDSVLFFQMRQSIAGVEKLHGALISHAGHESTRIFGECARIGAECRRLGDALVGARTPAKVALMFDWDNWWALELSSGPSRDLGYLAMVVKYYRAFYAQNIAVDILPVDGDLSRYEIVLAPLLYMLKPGVAAALTRFVSDGGCLLTSCFSGIVDENDRVMSGGYPGELKPVLGIWVEETDALLPGRTNTVCITQPWGRLNGMYTCALLCDRIHLRGARAIGVYGDDFYSGTPCLTRHDLGRGQAWYLATDAEARLLDDLAISLAQERDLAAPHAWPAGIEWTRRVKGTQEIWFFINHRPDAVALILPVAGAKDLLSGEAIGPELAIGGGDVRVILILRDPERGVDS
jgi:beta-galactosidase